VNTVFSIASVERETGLSRETLRIWERRYGFPKPCRDASGDRLFNAAEVERLQLIKRLLEMGYRPGRVVPLPMEVLQGLGQPEAAGQDKPATAGDTQLEEHLRLLRQGRLPELRNSLERRLSRLGLARMIHTQVAPLTQVVGEAWLKGELTVGDEHACTEIIQTLLRRALDKLPRPASGPRILMTTPAGELHGLGLLMAECLLTLEGAQCLSLGVNLPNRDIAAAAQTHAAQVVALSYSLAYPRRLIGGGLRVLRGLLRPEVEIWVGGQATHHLRLPAEVRRCVRLEDTAQMLRDWHRRHESPPQRAA
jgi:DNA-binding transcriptional MerR regulator